MEFLAILIALILLQVWGSGGPLQRDTWFFALHTRLASMLQGVPLQLAAVLLPAAGVGLLHHALHGAAYGLPELMLFVAVLLFSLGRGDISADVAEYLHRWGRGDFQAAFEQLRSETTRTPQVESTADEYGLHKQMRRHFYYRVHERLFAILFWFAIGGPAGAIAYRLAALEHTLPPAGEVSSERLRLLHWLDWLPARLLGLSYALIGNFDACLDAWRAQAMQSQADTAELIEACGDAALGAAVSPPAEPESRDDLIRRGARDIDAIESLQRRALVLWVVVIAVLAISF
jgi:AmpE protein